MLGSRIAGWVWSSAWVWFFAACSHSRTTCYREGRHTGTQTSTQSTCTYQPILLLDDHHAYAYCVVCLKELPDRLGQLVTEAQYPSATTLELQNLSAEAEASMVPNLSLWQLVEDHPTYSMPAFVRQPGRSWLSGRQFGPHDRAFETSSARVKYEDFVGSPQTERLSHPKSPWWTGPSRV